MATLMATATTSQVATTAAIDPFRMAWFDEAHKQCVIGARGSRENFNQFVSFPRAVGGKLDLENGTHAKPEESGLVSAFSQARV